MKKSRWIITFIVLFSVFLIPGWKGTEAEAAGNYTIYVNRKSNIVNVVDRKGKLVRAMYCSTGKNYSTIRGTYHTVAKYRWRALFGGVYGQYATRIHGHYLFHSVGYLRTRKDQVSTKEYNKLGSQASLGCVRLAVVDAKWIYDNCRTGTKVVIGESRKLTKPTRNLIKISTSKKTGWDPTDPDPSNPYYPKIRFKTGASKKIAYGSKFDPLAFITVSSKVTSKKDLMKSVKVTGSVKVKKPGKYKLTYKLTDSNTLLSRSLTVTYTVKKKPAKKAAATTEKKDKETTAESTEKTDTDTAAGASEIQG